MKTLATVFVLLLAAAEAYAVTIADTLKLPDGSLANGRLVITLTSGTSSSSQTYAAFRRELRITNGAVSVDLAANTALTPAGTYYRVEYYLNNGTSQTDYWNIPVGGPYTIKDVRWRARSPTGYEANMFGSTWTIPASVHGIRTNAMQVDCFDTNGNEFDCAVNVNQTTYDVTVALSVAQTGRIVIGAVSAWSTPNYVKSFTSSASISISYSEHHIPSSRITGECWDTSGNQFDCAVRVNTSTYAVTVTLASAQSGYIVLSGR